MKCLHFSCFCTCALCLVRAQRLNVKSSLHETTSKSRCNGNANPCDLSVSLPHPPWEFHHVTSQNRCTKQPRRMDMIRTTTSSYTHLKNP